MCKNKHIRLGVTWILAMAVFLLSTPVLANPCPVSDPTGMGPNTLPYVVTQHNAYGSCSYSGAHLIYFAEALDGDEIVLTQKLIISRANLTIGDSVVAVSIDATAVTADCVFQCNQPTDFVNITEISVCEGVQAFCDSNCQGSVNVSEVVGCVDCEDTGLPDIDGDGACDIGPSPDNCLEMSNPSQSDTDNDGVGNACDACPNDADPDQADFDNDGVGDACDNCPYESDPTQQDSDNDDVGNLCDNCPYQSNMKQQDSDSDGDGNACDAYPNDPYNQEGGCLPANDFDGDGLCNVNDAFPNDPSEQYDSDGDGVGDNSDNCVLVPNPSQLNTDGNGFGDACDNNDDTDILIDGVDNCPTVANATCVFVPSPSPPPLFILECSNTEIIDPFFNGDPNADPDGDGVINYCDACPADPVHYALDAVCVAPSADSGDDSDGVPPLFDNCPDVYNPTQADTDDDDLGDACDDDADGDGFVDNVEDNCPSVFNPDQIDSNDDGIGDACDTIGDDTDGDGVPDSLEISANCNPENPDTDNDGLEDGVELMNGLFCDDPDSDGDGVVDGIDGITDVDGDGKINSLDTDADGDGISDGVEMQYGTGDVDGDGLLNFLDTDSDNDNIPDTNERLADSDFDGTPDFIDAEFNPSPSQNVGDGANDYYEGTAGNGCSLNVAAKKIPPFFPTFLFAAFFLCVLRMARKKSFVIVCAFFLLMTACGGNEDIPDLSSDVSLLDFFPHGLNWREPVNHGATALTLFRQGQDVPFGESCQGCHGANFEGGSGPSCYTCHEIFPHLWNEWTDTGSSGFHGIVALNNGMFETCGTQCHGVDLNGGLTGKSCYSCHPLAPHVVENPNIQNYFVAADSMWRDFSVHGAFAIANNAVAAGMCATNCHGRDYTGGLTGRSCFDCHAPYPHVAQSDNWIDDHRAYVNTNTDATCITENGCHTNKNFGPTTVEQSCTDYCHVVREGL